MKIIRGQLKPFGGRAEYVTGFRKLVSLINNNKGDVFQFVILAETDDEKRALTPGGRAPSRVFDFGPDTYINEEILKFQEDFGPIIIGDVRRDERRREVVVETPYIAQFNADGSIEVVTETNESLPREQTVNQWKKLRKMTRGVDIGDRISDMNKQGANIQYIQNPVDSGIESYEDFEKKNKSFIPSWNLKHLLSPYGYENKKKK